MVGDAGIEPATSSLSKHNSSVDKILTFVSSYSIKYDDRYVEPGFRGKEQVG